MIKESLPTSPESAAFSRRVMDKTFYPDKKRVPESSSIFLLDSLEREKADKMLELLSHPKLQTLIEQGQITLGAIKPRSEESKIGLEEDDEAADRLLSEVKPPLEVIFSVSLAPTKSDLERFYPESVQAAMKSRMEEGATVWERFTEYMQRGPVTYFLIYDPNSNAIAEWRKQIGATNPQKADPETIRGKFAHNIRQNLVHGSSGDTAEEAVQNVKNEIAWVLNVLSKAVSQADELSQVNNFPNEDFLREIDVIAPDEQVLLASTIVNSHRSGAETFLSAYALTSRNEQGDSRTTYLAEKSIVSMGDIKAKTESYSGNLRNLSSKGILTSKLFGVKEGSIYQEYIPGAESASAIMGRLNKGEFSLPEAQSIVEQLAKAARILDSEGYLIIGNFYENFIYSQGLFYFIDGGFDLGANGVSSSEGSLKTLTSSIKDVSLREYAESVYKA